MSKFRLAVMIALALRWGVPAAQPTQPAQPMTPAPPPASVATPRGPAMVTGTVGAGQTIMIPGSAAPGMLMNNGNGTSTILIPGSVPQVVPTPR